MKIIHCLNHFLPQHIAGTEMYVYALVKEMNSSAFDNLVIIPNYGAENNKEYIYENIRVVQYGEPSIVDRDLQMGKRKPDGLAVFIDLVKKEKAEVVHFHELAGSNGITLHHVKAAKDAGCEVVITFHLANYSCKTGTLFYKNEVACDGIINLKKCSLCCYHVNGLSDTKSSFLYSMANVLHRLNVDTTEVKSKIGTALGYPFIIEKLRNDLHLLAEYCDKIIVLSKWYYDILARNGIRKDKIVFIKQGLINSEVYFNKDTITRLPLTIIFVGRISHFKGVKMLIAAMKNLDAEKIYLDIYGDSGDKEYMDDCKKDSAAMNNISWKGMLSPGNVVSTMHQYDFLCLPSTFSEMSPLVIQEAFAAGIPVLASNVYGNVEQITEGLNGWLFRFKDSVHLAEKLSYLIENLSLVEEARKHLPVPVLFGDIASQHAILYAEVIESQQVKNDRH